MVAHPLSARALALAAILATGLAGCEALHPTTRLVDRAEAALEAGDLETAEALADQAIDATPLKLSIDRRRGRALYVLGAVAWRRGEVDESVKLLLEALELHPELEKAQVLLGDGQRALGLHDEALRSYEHAAQLSQEDPVHRVRLCRLYLDLYQQDPAAGACGVALELAPLDPGARAAQTLVLARAGKVDEAEAALAAIDGLPAEERATLERLLLEARLEGPGRSLKTRIDQEQEPFFPARAEFQTTLTRRGPSSGVWSDEPAPAGVREVRYPSAGRELRGWLSLPPGDGPAPALVYLHSGFAASAEEIKVAAPFAEAGWAVFLPTFRGESGNPGDHELYLGEAEDAAAAVRWLAAQPGVDPARVVAFGNAEGGVLAGLLSLWPDLPLLATGSLNGALPEQGFALLDPPFDRMDVTERRMRSWVHHLGSMVRPHHAWVGEDDWLRAHVEELRLDGAEAKAPLTVDVVEGDTTGLPAAATRAFLQRVGGPRL